MTIPEKHRTSMLAVFEIEKIFFNASEQVREDIKKRVNGNGMLCSRCAGDLRVKDSLAVMKLKETPRGVIRFDCYENTKTNFLALTKIQWNL